MPRLEPKPRGTAGGSYLKSPNMAGLMCESATVRDPTHGKRGGTCMGVFLFLEASQPCGTTYRLGMGCALHPKLASMIAVLSRLF
jgi:hypothetical protein